MKYTTNNSTRSVNIKIALQPCSLDHREINQRIICQSEDFSVDVTITYSNILYMFNIFTVSYVNTTVFEKYFYSSLFYLYRVSSF